MDFELSEELAALQETCRRIAQDKVKPRAREIDESGEYPQDIFEVFRDAGLLGLCIPEGLGGSGAGILGLTIAIEPWFCRSTDKIKFDTDGWTIRSADGSRTAHSEHTVAITASGPQVLTRRPTPGATSADPTKKPATAS